jgi:hypothetical protein
MRAKARRRRRPPERPGLAAGHLVTRSKSDELRSARPRLQPVKPGREQRLNVRVVTVRLPARSRATTRSVWRPARKSSALIHAKNRPRVDPPDQVGVEEDADAPDPRRVAGPDPQSEILREAGLRAAADGVPRDAVAGRPSAVHDRPRLVRNRGRGRGTLGSGDGIAVERGRRVAGQEPAVDGRPVEAVFDVRARMFPLNVVVVPRVAELPTCQKTLHD